MSDISAIRVLNFTGKKEEWSTWSEKFLAKARRSGIKDVLLGKVSIPKTNEEINEKTDEGKIMMKIFDLNELAYTELILSIDVRTSSGKVAFNMVKGCKNKDYTEGNAAMAWERLKNKYEPTSAPSLVKTERLFRQSSLSKNEDPDAWITTLEEFRMKLEDMGSAMTDDQFMIHVLNNLTSDYELQMVLLEKRIGNKENPLEVDELREELNLRFERLSTQNESNNESKANEEQALFTAQFKGKCRNCGVLGHKSIHCKARRNHNDRQNDGNPQPPYCVYCRKSGHVKANCFILNRRNEANGNGNNNVRNGVAGTTADVVFNSVSENSEFSKNIWIGDSGASCHYCNCDQGLFDVKDVSERITVGNGKTMEATKIGSLRCNVEQVNGKTFQVVLQEVKFVPELWVNLFSINKALKNGFKIGNDDIIIHLSKGSTTLSFDRVLKTKNGFVSGVCLNPVSVELAGNVVDSKKAEVKFDINKLHKAIGHCGEEALKITAKSYDWKLLGKLETCEDCAVGKAKQKNTNKEWLQGSKNPGERLYIDISSIKGESFGGSKFWALIIDDCTNYIWSYFMNKKSSLKEKITSLILELKDQGIKVKILRCDDAGENKALEDECKSKGLGITFEYSGPRTPQRNGKVERKFQTLYGRIRAMLNGAGLQEEMRSGIWAECASTATFYSNILATRVTKKSPQELLFGKKSHCAHNLRVFGEMGIVTTKKKIQGKLKDRGTVCMFTGYPPNHACDVYRMLNLKTKHIFNSRDIVWLNKSFGEWDKKDEEVNTEIDEQDEDEFIEEVRKEPDAPVDTEERSPKPKLLSQMKKLQGWFNPEASRIVETLKSGREMILDQADIAMMMLEGPMEPVSFDEAFNHSELESRVKWRSAINKEFKEMDVRGVWKKISKSEMPAGRRCVKSKWVFKIKRNGVFRARLVACGYSQVPGLDFNDSFAPVVNDVTFRILLVAMLVWNLKAKIIDVETAFLHGDLKEEIFMEIPQGMDADKEDCLSLNKTIYGLVQSARQFYIKLVEALKSCGFKGSEVDPCLWTKHSSLGMVMMAIYVDDCLTIGTDEAIEEVINALKGHNFGLKVEDNLTDYLSCKIVQERDKGKAWIMQPHLIENLEKKFGEEVNGMKSYTTPGTPRFKIVRPTSELEGIEGDMQSRYRSGVGMLLYLIKHSRPDIANVVRELSKCMDGATLAAYKEMLRVIRFVLDTKLYCLKMEPKKDEEDWNLMVYSDSDWAGDTENRISITGFIIYLLGVPICWRSKGQKGVTLSSSEAEYVAMSEAVKEIRFVYYLLVSLGIAVKLPIIVRTDNIGAIFMAENASSGVRTRHIDTRYHFIREHLEDGFIKIIFVRTNDNDADIFTKNVNKETYEKHVEKFLGKW